MLNAEQSAELVYQAALNIVDHARRLASSVSVGYPAPIELFKLHGEMQNLSRAVAEFEAAPMKSEQMITRVKKPEGFVEDAFGRLAAE